MNIRKKTTSWITVFVFIFSLINSTMLSSPRSANAYDAPPKDQGHTGPNPLLVNPTGPQCDPNQSNGGDPVQSKTGNFTFDQEDLFLLGLGSPLCLKRFYSSFDLYDGPFGFGWNHSFNISILEFSAAEVIIRDGDGIRYQFMRNQDGSYISPKGRFLKLVKIGTNAFKLYQKDLTEYDFSDNRIVSITDSNGNQTRFEYLGDGKLSKVTNQSGRYIQIVYGPNSKAASAIDNIGRTVSYHYDQNNNLISVVNPLGNATVFSYDTNHRLLSIRDAKGNLRIQNTYDSSGRVTQQISSGGTFQYTYYDNYTRVQDRKGNCIYHYFNGDGNPTQDIDELGYSTYRTWNAEMQLTEEKDAKVNITKYAYDSSGNLMIVTDALNNSIEFTYHPLFNHLSSIKDALGRTTSFFYDANGNLTQKTDAIGNITSYEYNAAGQPVKTIDEARREILLSYDNLGNLLTITDNQGNITGFEYDDAGRRTKLIDALGNSTTYQYDALDRLIKQIGPSGEVSTFVFDETGNLIQLTDPNGNTSTYGYDIYDHLISAKDALGNTTRFEYDLNENMTAATDALGRRTMMSYDKANRLISMTRPDGISIDFGYDPVGNNTSIKDHLGNLTQFIYDAVNRPIRTNYSDGSFETRSYDAVGNILVFKDRSGKELSYQYDNVDRIKLKRYPNTGDITVEYNELGFIRSVSNSVGTISYFYDTLDRISQVSDVYNRILNYSFDAIGRRVSMTDSLGEFLAYGYDASSRLINLGTTAGQVNFSYDSGGRLIQRRLPNGIKSQFFYDAADRLTSIEHRNADDSIVDHFTYQYDAVGNRIQATTADGAFVEYEYDILNRLIKETEKNNNGEVLSNIQYEYDANGNRISLNQDGIQTFYSYNSFNQLISGGNAGYHYDGNGNLERIIEGTNDTAYYYNDQNFLTSVTFPDGNNVAFEYDGINRRVLKTDSSGATRYLFDNTLLISETDNLDTVKVRYHAANGVVSQTGLSGILYYLSDGQGSTRYLLNSTGNIVAEYAYDAFGNLVTQSGSYYNPFTFSADYGYYHNSADLYHIGARHYRPDLGRFLQVDPLHQGSNWYVYALNDPVNLVDPTGEWVHIAIGGGIGAAVNTGVYLISTPHEQLSYRGGVRAAATGAVVGAVGATTFGASMPATLGGAIIRGGATGLTTTLAGDLTNSAFNQKLRFSSPYTYATNMAIGGAIAGGTYGVGKAIQNYRSTHASKRTTVLGENMMERVIPYAEKTGSRTLPFDTTADEWAKTTSRQRWKLNDGTLRERINEGDNFIYIGRDPYRDPALRKQFDLTGSELFRLEERGVPYNVVPRSEVQKFLGRP